MASWEEAEGQIELKQRQIAREHQQVVAAEQRREQQKQQGIRLRDKLLDIVYADLSATPQERKRVEALMRAHKPEKYGDPDATKVMLLTIRSLTGKA
jgi:hypothetical protein